MTVGVDSEITLYEDPGRLSTPARTALLETFVMLERLNWETEPDYDRGEPQDWFANGSVIVVACAGDVLVGYQVWQRVWIDDCRILYGASAQVAPRCQGRGLASAMKRRVFSAELRDSPDDPVYIAWITRNPITWESDARLCSRVVPSLLQGADHPKLLDLARAFAAGVLPGYDLELPSLILRGCSRYRARTAPRHRNPAVNAIFDTRLGPRDGFLSVGELVR